MVEYNYSKQFADLNKDTLVDSLIIMRRLMIENAEILKVLHEDKGFHKQLTGAAEVASNWIDVIKNENGE